MDKWIAVALVGALASCSTAAEPAKAPKATATSVASPHASFAQYQTFSFGLADPPKAGYEVTPRSLEVERRLRPIVLESLKAHGYTESDSSGDFVVKLVTGTGAAFTQGTLERATPTGLARGFIGINIYDGPTGAQVWQGSAFAEIDPEKIDDSLLKLGVTHMLADFPSKSAAGVASAR